MADTRPSPSHSGPMPPDSVTSREVGAPSPRSSSTSPRACPAGMLNENALEGPMCGRPRLGMVSGVMSILCSAGRPGRWPAPA
jgi:hypothetical protein